MTYLLATALAVTGAGLILPTQAADWPAAPDMTIAPPGTVAAPDLANRQLADEKVSKDVCRALARLINDGYTNGKFSDLVGHLSKADRERIGKFRSEKRPDLDLIIDRFRADFKAKYSKDFDFSEDNLHNLVKVYQGADKTHVIVDLAGLDPSAMAMNDPTKGIGEKLGAAAHELTGAAAKRMVTLNLINEGTILNAWRIELAGQLTGEQLKDALLKHIVMLDEQKDTWPSDLSRAYSAAGWHLFEALKTSSLASEK